MRVRAVRNSLAAMTLVVAGPVRHPRRGVVEIDGDDLLWPDRQELSLALAGGEPVPRVDHEAHVLRRDLREQLLGRGHGVDEGVAGPAVEARRADVFQP